MNKKIFAIVVVTMLFSMLGMGIIAPLLPIYADELGATPFEIGLISAGFSITNMVLLPFTGGLSDRVGRKMVLCVGLLLLSIASFGFIWAGTPLQLILVRCFQGVGASMHLSIAQAYLGDMVPEGEEGKWMGYFNASVFTGIGSGPLLGGVLTDVFNANTTFLVMAALNIIGLIATIIYVPEGARKTASGKKGGASYLGMLKSNVMMGVFLLRMATGFITANQMTFLPVYAYA